MPISFIDLLLFLQMINITIGISVFSGIKSSSSPNLDLRFLSSLSYRSGSSDCNFCVCNSESTINIMMNYKKKGFCFICYLSESNLYQFTIILFNYLLMPESNSMFLRKNFWLMFVQIFRSNNNFHTSKSRIQNRAMDSRFLDRDSWRVGECQKATFIPEILQEKNLVTSQIFSWVKPGRIARIYIKVSYIPLATFS